MFKKLLNKMKLFKKFCVAVFTGNMYAPWIIEEMKAEKEIEKRQAEEKIKYAKGGVIEPIVQKFELDEGEVIVPLNTMIKIDKTVLTPEKMQELREQATPFTEYITKLVAAEMERFARKAERENTNNWRKMHGLPMRRKAGRKK